MSSESQLPQAGIALQQAIEEADVEIVDRERYTKLSISNKALVRADDPENNMRGLFDPREKIRYLISEGNLFTQN
ncbi:hypothetical protein A3D88_04070 [Candidatus Peribacteria bacterium RIFCSPHIGHO2_02_FULL_52_16]|nr:MAG: hypothetical protein A2706_03425 [Candidatus Peribacteria bacterium RIFCSPHIGHO2_01_FULL_51_35]OGJ60748.1 MAG: hypothetical protein A3D88_04070 [Candidatus Peribacteria bacterium RIFCSPHIGHO2_02_FULL_52_16]